MPTLIPYEDALRIDREVRESIQRLRLEHGEDFLRFPEEPVGPLITHVTGDATTPKPPHRVMRRNSWLDGPWAYVMGFTTLLIGLGLGNSAMGYFACGAVGWIVGMMSGMICDYFDVLTTSRPVFTFSNRLYVALRRWTRCHTAAIRTKYRVGQFVYDHLGCGSTIEEVTAWRGKIYYRLYGFDYDYRESQLRAR